MKLIWCSDIHLDHLGPRRRQGWFASVAAAPGDALLVTGDISDGEQLIDTLQEWSAHESRPVYYVLGNHDAWSSDLTTVRQACSGFSVGHPNFIHMNTTPFVSLDGKTALVGHDCWYDARYGDPLRSTFHMLDWTFIDDYNRHTVMTYVRRTGQSIVHDKQAIIDISRRLAQEGVDHIEAGIDAAVAAGHTKVIVASHPPPFDDAHFHEGVKGDDNAQPWFTCRSLGEALLHRSSTYRDVVFASFSGHTHGPANLQVSRNLSVHVAGARYGSPEVTSTIEV